MNLKDDFMVIAKQIREERPLIHHLTNYVTAESCADVCLAAGASPIMADDIAEIEEMIPRADAVVINLGTMGKNQVVAMEMAAKIAHINDIPVILDPAGVMSSVYRLDFALQLLRDRFINIVRGNMSECVALLGEKADSRGMDNTLDSDKALALATAKDLATKFNCVVALTGAVDYISDGKKAIVLNNGNPLLKDITGAGCMTSSLVGCCAAVAENMLTAATLGVVIMGQSAELAAHFLDKKDGPGMFKARLFDGVYHVTSKFDVLNLDPTKMQ